MKIFTNAQFDRAVEKERRIWEDRRQYMDNIEWQMRDMRDRMDRLERQMWEMKHGNCNVEVCTREP